jgi:H+-transporting ATPase
VRAKLRNVPAEQLLKRLESSRNGITPAEAERRLRRYGPNELDERRVSLFVKIIGYFWGPIPWMIETAAAISAVVQHWVDFTIIGVLLVMNATVGFWEEYQASNTVTALKATLARNARVKRNGRWATVPTRELVPGDIVRLRIGDIVPADAKLLEGDPLQVDQSALTGESLPVQRTTEQVVYSGSVVKQGEIDAVVYATGGATFFGETARLMAEAHTISHFQRAVLRIGNYLIVVAAALAALIIAVAWLRGDSLITTLRFVLVLTVAAVPVAMPTVMSVTMAVGARLLARRKAIVTKLASIEELAGIDILCSDKTGTLTQNRLTLGQPHAFGAHTEDEVILAAGMASRSEDDDPIDLAVLDGVKDRKRLESCQVVHYQPFDPVQKRTEATIRENGGREYAVSKGAPQVILRLLADAERAREDVEKVVEDHAARGFRSLAVARTDERGKWELLGILPLFDPPRVDSSDVIRAAGRMGIGTKMLTGDQLAIAQETARRLGLGTNILDAELFEQDDNGDRGRISNIVERSDGFAQVFPKHKFRIIQALQQRGHIVGMTGDGVNDAPPLKQADAGIAVSGATDAARAAADIVLLEPGLSVIIEAIRASRKIFQRMTNYAIYRITETIRVLLFMTLSIVIFNFYPLTPVMIVLLALLNDGAILSIAYDRVLYPNQPARWAMSTVLTVATVLGMVGLVESFALFYFVEQWAGLGRDFIQSLMYLKLSVAGHLMVFVARTRGPFWTIRPSKILLAAVLGTQMLATLIVVYGVFMPAIGWGWAATVWAYAAVWLFIADGAKLLTYRVLERESRSWIPVEEHVESTA